ncbi:MAG: chromosome condensation regulator, partial [Pseudomonadota bacterium]|nr:chromosome condensation regulator [Pseudomonadota bacterium]
GLGDNNRRHTFTAVPPLPDGKVAKQVVAGNGHTMILAEDGTVFACGSNESGQLGLGDVEDRDTFTAVPPLPDGKVAKQVVAGIDHTMILAEDGTVFACGSNIYGQLGLGNNDDRHTFTAVPPLPDGKVAKQVVAGSGHTMILAEDGTVFACGYNRNGQLGLGNNDDRDTFTAVPPLPDG